MLESVRRSWILDFGFGFDFDLVKQANDDQKESKQQTAGRQPATPRAPTSSLLRFVTPQVATVLEASARTRTPKVS